jgi:TonB family protein
MVLKKENKEGEFIKTAYYKGGEKALSNFIYSNLKYPKEAFENKIEGVIVCKTTISHSGHVTEVKIIKELGFGCDEEAIRVIKMLQFEVPKNQKGLKVTFHKDFKIQFKMQNERILNEVKPTLNETKLNNTEQPKLNFNYSYVEKKVSPETEPKVQKANYTFTIKY